MTRKHETTAMNHHARHRLWSLLSLFFIACGTVSAASFEALKEGHEVYRSSPGGSGSYKRQKEKKQQQSLVTRSTAAAQKSHYNKVRTSTASRSQREALAKEVGGTRGTSFRSFKESRATTPAKKPTTKKNRASALANENASRSLSENGGPRMAFVARARLAEPNFVLECGVVEHL